MGSIVFSSGLKRSTIVSRREETGNLKNTNP